jgi:hypothetical protein
VVGLNPSHACFVAVNVHPTTVWSPSASNPILQHGLPDGADDDAGDDGRGDEAWGDDGGLLLPTGQLDVHTGAEPSQPNVRENQNPPVHVWAHCELDDEDIAGGDDGLTGGEDGFVGGDETLGEDGLTGGDDGLAGGEDVEGDAGAGAGAGAGPAFETQEYRVSDVPVFVFTSVYGAHCPSQQLF